MAKTDGFIGAAVVGVPVGTGSKLEVSTLGQGYITVFLRHKC